MINKDLSKATLCVSVSLSPSSAGTADVCPCLAEAAPKCWEGSPAPCPAPHVLHPWISPSPLCCLLQNPEGRSSPCCQAAPVPSLCSLPIPPSSSCQTLHPLFPLHTHDVSRSLSCYPLPYRSQLPLTWICFSPPPSVPVPLRHHPTWSPQIPSLRHLKSPL